MGGCKLNSDTDNVHAAIIGDIMELVPPPNSRRQMREQRSSNAQEEKEPSNLSIFMECTNFVESSTPTSANSTTNANNFLTPSPSFKFQEYEEAEKNLEPGQKLLSCRKCRGPVPSPATPVLDSQERRRSSQSPRCRLISRIDKHHQPESPKKRDFKKARTLSSVDLSPIPPVTIASLGDQMSHVSLAVSSPCLINSSSTAHLPLPSPQEFETVKRSTSCSSITGIDLPHHVSGEVDSPIDLHVNINSYDNSPFYASHPPSHHRHNQVGFFSGDLDDSVFNCSRSCSPRRVHNCSQLHYSQFSDSGLSCDGDSIDEYSNMVLSPDEPTAHASSRRSNRNSIERARDVSTNQYSDGALSLSSFSHLQRSDHSLNYSSFDNNNESDFPNVLECPNPQCGYRFCSVCEEGEHPGRPCHILSSDQFESIYFENNNSNGSLRVLHMNRNSNGQNSNNYSSRDNINSSCSSSKSSSNKKNSSSSSSKSSKHKNSKKSALRRVARL